MILFSALILFIPISTLYHDTLRAHRISFVLQGRMGQHLRNLALFSFLWLKTCGRLHLHYTVQHGKGASVRKWGVFSSGEQSFCNIFGMSTGEIRNQNQTQFFQTQVQRPAFLFFQR